MAYVPDVPEVEVGIMRALPQGDGYKVVFKDYQLIG
jgi:regulation of enolase protein 1 (concanavalin A-like superfamily)